MKKKKAVKKPQTEGPSISQKTGSVAGQANITPKSRENSGYVRPKTKSWEES
jgi:hypothetical protein